MIDPTPPPPHDTRRPEGVDAWAEPAWLYLVGGLDAEQTEAFETALLTEFAAQIALAEAVPMIGTLQEVSRPLVTPVRSDTTGFGRAAASAADSPRSVASPRRSRPWWTSALVGGGLLVAGVTVGVVLPARWRDGLTPDEVETRLAGRDRAEGLKDGMFEESEAVALSRAWWSVSHDPAFESAQTEGVAWGWSLDDRVANERTAPRGPAQELANGTDALTESSGAFGSEAGPPAWLVAAVSLTESGATRDSGANGSDGLSGEGWLFDDGPEPTGGPL